MASLEENSAWESSIYQLEETDRAQAGAGGVLNIQARQLANRTRFLRSKLASLEAECTELGLSIDTFRQNLGSSEIPGAGIVMLGQKVTVQQAMDYLLNKGNAVRLSTYCLLSAT
ncbi:hypothetical protein ACI8EP_25075, partial [Klebsiella michiganensis]